MGLSKASFVSQEMRLSLTSLCRSAAHASGVSWHSKRDRLLTLTRRASISEIPHLQSVDLERSNVDSSGVLCSASLYPLSCVDFSWQEEHCLNLLRQVRVDVTKFIRPRWSWESKTVGDLFLHGC